MTNLTRWAIAIFCASGLSLMMTNYAGAESEISAYRAKLEKWVEARETLSKERADWLVDKEYLKSTRNLLQQEKVALEAEVAEFEEQDEGAGERRRELLLERGDYQRTEKVLADQIAELEAQVLDVARLLPEPLQKKLEPLLVQIPADPARVKVPIGSRLMNVLGVLVQAEKFNRTATLVGETRSLGGDQKVQVRTLYWGLGQAIYVDSKGETAGVARPSQSGWQFEDDPKLASRASELLDIYEGNVDTISFVPIPVEIQ